MENLEVQREKIDVIDRQIVSLLEERLKVVEEVARIKKEQNIAVLDTAREQKVLEKVAQYVEEPKYRKIIQDTYQSLMDISKAYQKDKIEDKKCK
ncbi:chorismate mutase [Vagococcus elongatus]|uniref:Chorismate mutase n=1 Tax=Vagococcus elongatus TaxID=180344 RepID=A0A430APS2_9ENTE|nr:chorismate mutase [Vagococcus elongatus]RSU09983.1 chorismate mutase [Vagococcus elongatus]